MALITLTSDIGQQDYLVGAIKGQLLQINPAFNLVDITFTKSFPKDRVMLGWGVRNIFNVTNITTNTLSGEFHQTDGDFIPYSIGRFFFATLKLKIYKK